MEQNDGDGIGDAVSGLGRVVKEEKRSSGGSPFEGWIGTGSLTGRGKAHQKPRQAHGEARRDWRGNTAPSIPLQYPMRCVISPLSVKVSKAATCRGVKAQIDGGQNTGVKSEQASLAAKVTSSPMDTMWPCPDGRPEKELPLEGTVKTSNSLRQRSARVPTVLNLVVTADGTGEGRCWNG